MKWTMTEHLEPPKNVLLDVLMGDRKTQSQLVFDGKMYWMPDMVMYVYYIPTAWRVSQDKWKYPRAS